VTRDFHALHGICDLRIRTTAHKQVKKLETAKLTNASRDSAEILNPSTEFITYEMKLSSISLRAIILHHSNILQENIHEAFHKLNDRQQ
jgi:hypothetical protein